jgi:hypothetical protein
MNSKSHKMSDIIASKNMFFCCPRLAARPTKFKATRDYSNTRLHQSCLNPVIHTGIYLPLRQSNNAANCMNASDSGLRASVCGVITKSLARSVTWSRCERAVEVEEGQRTHGFVTCHVATAPNTVGMITHCVQ